MEYFKGVVLQAVNVNLAGVRTEKISVLEASVHLDALAKHCGEAIQTEFARFGLELVNFFFHSINIPDEDASYQRLKVIKEKAAELKVLGRDIYQFDRSMEVLKTAAANEGGGAGLMQAGVGLAVGAGIGQQMAPQAAQLVTKLPPGATPPLPGVVKFHVSVGNQDIGETELEAIKKLVAEGKVNRATLVWRDGMAGLAGGGNTGGIEEGFSTANTSRQLPPGLKNYEGHENHTYCGLCHGGGTGVARRRGLSAGQGMVVLGSAVYAVCIVSCR